MGHQAEVSCVRRGAVGLATLEAQGQGIVLNHRLCRDLRAGLDAWAVDPDIAVVVIRAAPGQGFCTGADAHGLRRLIADGDRAAVAGFFRDAYRLIYAIHAYPKPLITLGDGLISGLGVGFALAAGCRVVTERTVLTLPETASGFFPDGGACRLLAQCPGEVGVYLGLTGAALTGADAVLAGLADCYLSSAHLDRLVDRLAAGFELEAVLADLEADPGEGQLARLLPAINRLFAGQSVETIVARLEAGRSDFTTTQALTLKSCAPLSLKVTLRQLRRGRALDLAGALRLDYRLALHMVSRDDFLTGGFRRGAAGRGPVWLPATLDAATPAMIDSLFTPIEAGEFVPE